MQDSAEAVGWLIYKLFYGVIAIGLTIIGWNARTMRKDIDDTKEDLNELRVKISEVYVTKHDFTELKNDFREMIRHEFKSVGDRLVKIEEKLDTKADKKSL